MIEISQDGILRHINKFAVVLFPGEREPAAIEVAVVDSIDDLKHMEPPSSRPLEEAPLRAGIYGTPEKAESPSSPHLELEKIGGDASYGLQGFWREAGEASRELWFREGGILYVYQPPVSDAWEKGYGLDCSGARFVAGKRREYGVVKDWATEEEKDGALTFPRGFSWDDAQTPAPEPEPDHIWRYHMAYDDFDHGELLISGGQEMVHQVAVEENVMTVAATPGDLFDVRRYRFEWEGPRLDRMIISDEQGNRERYARFDPYDTDRLLPGWMPYAGGRMF